jgi:serine/threonine-protein kinase
MLDSMHAAGATHRDITPMNVFVSGNGTLKLGDFGIARHHVVGAPLTVDAFNPDFVTRGMRSYERRYWTPVDDIFQVGQLLAMLLTGQDEELLTPKQILALEGDPLLLTVCARAIGPRRRRYRDAFSMLMALEGDELSAGPDLRTLEGKTVAFTGPMRIRRLDAEVLVAQAGGTVAKRVTKEVDVLVQGSRSPNYKSGHVGEKLAAARSLIKKGYRIDVISEAQFRRLTLGEEHSS